jgi:hypothetical protein
MILVAKILLAVSLGLLVIAGLLSLTTIAGIADDNANYNDIYSNSEGQDHEHKKDEKIR